MACGAIELLVLLLLLLLLLMLVLVLGTSFVVRTLDDVPNGRGRGTQAKRRRRGRDGGRYRSHSPRGRGLGSRFDDGAWSGVATDGNGREGTRYFLGLTLMLILMGDDWRQRRRQGNRRGQRRGRGCYCHCYRPLPRCLARLGVVVVASLGFVRPVLDPFSWQGGQRDGGE